MLSTPTFPAAIPDLAAGYAVLANMFISESQQFLELSFRALSQQPKDSNSSTAFVEFLSNADTFCERCSERLASELRKASYPPEIYETSESMLIQIVRNRCFANSDTILLRLAESLECSGAQLGAALNQSSSPCLKDEIRRARLKPRRMEAVSSNRAENHPIVPIWEFVCHLDDLARQFLDYGAAKMFAGDVDLQAQNSWLQRIRNEIRSQRNHLLEFLEANSAIKHQKWNQLREVEEAKIREAAMAAARHAIMKRNGLGSLLLGLACAWPLWILSTNAPHSIYFVVIGALLGILAFVFVYRGIVRLI